jgi:hypothetical protein
MHTRTFLLIPACLLAFGLPTHAEFDSGGLRLPKPGDTQAAGSAFNSDVASIRKKQSWVLVNQRLLVCKVRIVFPAAIAMPVSLEQSPAPTIKNPSNIPRKRR